MKNLLLKHLDRICLAIVLIVALGGTAWTAVNIVTQIRRQHQANDRDQRELMSLQQAEKNLQALRKALAQVKEETAGLNKRVPPRTDMGALIQQLHMQMKERRITLTVLQPQEAIAEELYTKVPIRLVFQGAFGEIYRFFYDLEQMERLMVPEKITMSSSETSPECRVDMSVLVFERKTAQSGG